MTARPATPADAAAIAAVYNEGIKDRVATFETRPRTPSDIVKWFDGRHPVIVVEDEGRIVAFASTSTYRSRECYDGIAETSLYVAHATRGRGYGTAALEAITRAAEQAGFWKLVSRVFPENAASRALLGRAGFREVGVYHRHARLDGAWRDVIIVEKLIGDAANA